MSRSLLRVDDLTTDELLAVLDDADRFATDRTPTTDLAGRCVALLFEKPSTRTRLSLAVGVVELGGTPLVLSASELQLGRGETIEDTARTLSAYVAAITLRTHAHDRLEQLAAAATVPVVNALSDSAHPCQALADLLTVRQVHGDLEGRTLAYLGDGNNVAASLARAGAMVGCDVVLATPPGAALPRDVVAEANRLGPGRVTVTDDPLAAVADADVVYTDVWTSMPDPAAPPEDAAAAAQRSAALAPYRVDARLLAAAPPRAVVMHCLPAHRGEEITAEVLDGPRSVVWRQAANRLHAQKALLRMLVTAA